MKSSFDKHFSSLKSKSALVLKRDCVAIVVQYGKKSLFQIANQIDRLFIEDIFDGLFSIPIWNLLGFMVKYF